LIKKSGKPSVQSFGLKFMPNNQPFLFGCVAFKESRKISQTFALLPCPRR
jgi:hypothetical protein